MTFGVPSSRTWAQVEDSRLGHAVGEPQHGSGCQFVRGGGQQWFPGRLGQAELTCSV
jgi:hypothetical protein